MRLDGQLGIPSRSRCLSPPELPVSPSTSPVHGRRAFLGVPSWARCHPFPESAQMAPGSSTAGPWGASAVPVWAPGGTHLGCWKVARTQVGGRPLRAGGPPGLPESPRDVLCPPGLLCCTLQRGLSVPGRRGTGCLTCLWVLTLREALPTRQPFVSVLSPQLLRPNAQELSRVPCQPQWDPSPGDTIQDSGYRDAWASPLPPCAVGFVACFVWVFLFLSLL